MDIQLKDRRSVLEFTPRDEVITFVIDGVERAVQVWNDQDGYYSDWRAEDKRWYAGLADYEKDDLETAIEAAFIGGSV